MKRWFVAGLVLMLLCGCRKSKHISAVDEYLACTEELNRILDDVSNEGSVQTAVTKIEALGPRWKASREQVKALGDPPPDEQIRISAKLKEYDEQNKERNRTNNGKMNTYRALQQAYLRALGNPMEPSPKWLNTGERPGAGRPR